MSFHLTVAGSLEPLADSLAELLAEPHPSADPFQSELIVVPSAGVRAWLGARLAERLGATERGSDGIAANLDWEFPGRIVTVALGPDSDVGAWETDRLTWTVYDELVADGDRYGQPVDAVRARTIADLFDSYTLHRRSMVLAWERNQDHLVGGVEMDDSDRWQARLWRAVRERTGGRSGVDAMRDLLRNLRDGVIEVEAPARVIVFGIAGLPAPHLELLGALSGGRDVHVFAPTPSAARWRRLVAALPADLALPIPRDDEQFPSFAGNPLVTNWGRSSIEAHALLHLTATGAGASIDDRGSKPADRDDPSLLQRVQRDIVTDVAPPGAPRSDEVDTRLRLSASDDSIRWLTCFGPARQVEVLRDAVLHLLAETGPDGSARYAPRDIAIVTPDIARFAPLVQAVFAGDAEHGVPPIPLEVADRSLRQDNPLVDALFQLFDLTEGRFRATDVLRFISSPVVGRRFALDAAAVERITTWVEAANVRWGIDGSSLDRFGVPAGFDAFTWRSAIDRLLLGAVMPDGPSRLGLGDVPPMPGIEGEDVVIAGRLAELTRRLELAVERLTTPAPVGAWCDAVADSVSSLFALSADDAWASRAVDRAVTALADESRADGRVDDVDVDPGELAALLTARLEAGSSRPRFGTGAVTLSSFTAQRGVPFPIVCVLGLDVEAASVATADDLIAARPCIGDRDARSEQRAQMLDAVLSAGDRLLLLSNGRDVRTNTDLPPVAMLAEFLDVLDATAIGVDDRPARRCIVVEHPRQAWSEASFLTGGLGVDGPWAFDRGALAAFRARAHQARESVFLPEPLSPADDSKDSEDSDGIVRIPIGELVRACTEPVRAFLSGRLGISVFDSGTVDAADDAIPFSLGGLEQSAVDRSLLEARTSSDWSARRRDEWCEVVERSGAVPPGSLASDAIATAEFRVASVLALAADHIDMSAPVESMPVRLEVPSTTPGAPNVLVEGAIDGIRGDTLASVGVSRLRAAKDLEAWILVALLTATDPSRPWRSVVIGRAEEERKATKKEPAVKFSARSVQLVDPAQAHAVLEFAIDMWRATRCDAIPFFPSTSRWMSTNAEKPARRAWDDSYQHLGDRYDRWNAVVFDLDFDALSALPPRDHEAPSGSRLKWWADRVWSTVGATAVVTELAASPGLGLEVSA